MLFFELRDLVIRAIATLPALVAAYLSLKTSRSPQGAVGWIVLILAYPYVGVPVYAVFGYANYAKFARERRRSDARIGEDGIDECPPPEPENRLAVFSHLSGNRVTEGCDMRLLIDGEETFDTVFEAISRARHYVLVQYYTIMDDEIGQRLQDVLVERAQAGIAVYLLHDELPLIGLPRRYWKCVETAGVSCARPKGPTRLLGPFQWNYRNHRKLIVIDGTEGYTGGLNCSKTYIGKSQLGPWRDTFASFRGPVVNQLERSFAADWAWATGDDIRGIFREASPAGEMRAVTIPMGPTDQINTGNLYFVALAQRARHRLWITTPYFVPDADVMSALQLAALRGVDLKILVPHRVDHWAPYWAAYAYFDDIREVGGEIWRYEPAFMHQKVALVDDDLCSVGSVNLDVRSGLLNFELTVVTESTDAARQVETMLRRDFSNAFLLERSLAEQPPWRRVLARVSRLMAPQL